MSCLTLSSWIHRAFPSCRLASSAGLWCVLCHRKTSKSGESFKINGNIIEAIAFNDYAGEPNLIASSTSNHNSSIASSSAAHLDFRISLWQCGRCGHRRWRRCECPCHHRRQSVVRRVGQSGRSVAAGPWTTRWGEDSTTHSKQGHHHLITCHDVSCSHEFEPE